MNMAEMYQQAILQVKALGHPNGETHELLNFVGRCDIDPTACIVGRPGMRDYIKKELDLHKKKERLGSEWAKLSSIWEYCTDDNATINSAYGYIAFARLNGNMPQYRRVAHLIAGVPETRRAIIQFFDREIDLYTTRDAQCTNYMAFHERENYEGKKVLHVTTHMRSNDLMYGMPFDIPTFFMIAETVRQEINKISNTTGTDSEIQFGNYTHIVDSLHWYNRHESVLNATKFELGKL